MIRINIRFPSQPNEGRQVMTTLYSLEDTISRRQEEIVTEGGGKPSWTKKLLLDNQLLCSKIRYVMLSFFLIIVVLHYENC
jgi:hypothetical protein